MDIRVLGCHESQMPCYNTTSSLLDNKVLVDADTITPLLAFEEQNNIRSILITHVHLDHVKEMMCFWWIISIILRMVILR